MEEKIVKKVFKNYLEKREKKPIKLRKDSAAGPDFVIEGKAYECKGSKLVEKSLFIQLLSYAFQYSSISLVIPYDALKFTLLWQLEAIEKFIREHPNVERTIEVYLISESEDKVYALCNWSAKMLNCEISSIIYNLIPNFANLPSVKEKEEKILEFLRNFEQNMKTEIKNLIIKKAKESDSIWKATLIDV